MPAIRGMISASERKVGHFDDQPAVLEFVGSQRTWRSSPRSAPPAPTISCAPRSAPLVVDFDPARPDIDKTLAGLAAAIEEYREGYAAYYERCKHADSPPMRDPNAVVYLVPGVGMITFAKDKATARISGEFYVNAINVMRGASGVSTLCGPARAGSLRHRVLAARGSKAAAHAEAEAAGRQASRWSPAAPAASARPRPTRFLRDGACVVLADIDATALAAADAGARRGATRRDVVRGVRLDVTDEEQDVIDAFTVAARSSAASTSWSPMPASASSAPIEDTDACAVEPATWTSSPPAISWSAREAFRLLKQQKTGGCDRLRRLQERALPPRPTQPPIAPPRPPRSISPAAWRWRAREFGIRVNTVNPDAVLRGSKIWTGEWREQRAAAYNTGAGRAGGALPQALDAEARRLSGGHRRGRLLPRLRHCRPNRPATSSTSTPATRRGLRGSAGGASTLALVRVPIGPPGRPPRMGVVRQAERSRTTSLSATPPRVSDLGSSQPDRPRPPPSPEAGRRGGAAAHQSREDTMTTIDRRGHRRRPSNDARDNAATATTPISASSSTRRGIDIDAVKNKVAALWRRHPVLGRRHRRHALRPLLRATGEPRNIFDKIEDCAVINELTRATPTVSLHIPWDKADPTSALKQAARTTSASASTR